MADLKLTKAQQLKAVALARNPTEAALAQRHERLANAQLPEPGAEAWKYSPVNRLYEALLKNSADQSPTSSARGAQIICDSASTQVVRSSKCQQQPAQLRAAIATTTNIIDPQRYPLADAALLLTTEFIDIDITADTDKPVLISQATGNIQVNLRIAAGVRASVIQTFGSLDGCTSITTVELERGAQLEHATTGGALTGTHWRLNSVLQQADSSYHLYQLSLGGSLQRVDNHVQLAGAGAHVQILGCLLSGQGQRNDTQSVVEHAAPNCSSLQRYQGVAAGDGRLTLGGRIHIHSGATGTNAELQNPNLLLDDAATVNTKPELEIYNDDVRCTHGATVGRLDAASVFYLRSRGLSEPATRALLLRGFISAGIAGPDKERALSQANTLLESWTH